jgi:Tfp pilus assembly protein PilO
VVVVIALFIAKAINGNLGGKVSLLQRRIAEQKKVNTSGVTLHKLQVEFDGYKKSVPEDINPFSAVERINKVASETSVKLISVVPAEARDKTIYLEYPISIKLETNYFEMASFLKKLEDLKIFRVVSMDIAPLSGSEEYRRTTVQKLIVNMSLLAVALKK